MEHCICVHRAGRCHDIKSVIESVSVSDHYYVSCLNVSGMQCSAVSSEISRLLKECKRVVNLAYAGLLFGCLLTCMTDMVNIILNNKDNF